MDTKKEIMRFIRPNFIPPIIFTLWIGLNWVGPIIFFCITLPTYLRGKKRIKELEASGEFKKVIAEWSSPNAKRLVKGKVILTENYIFCKKKGCILPYDEVLWAYELKYRCIKSFTSLLLATKEKLMLEFAMPDGKTEDVPNAITEIYNHNKECLVGNTPENAAIYKQLTSNK